MDKGKRHSFINERKKEKFGEMGKVTKKNKPDKRDISGILVIILALLIIALLISDTLLTIETRKTQNKIIDQLNRNTVNLDRAYDAIKENDEVLLNHKDVVERLMDEVYAEKQKTLWFNK